MALIVDHIAVFIELKGAGTGIGAIQVGQAIGGHKESIPLNRQVQRVIGKLQRPLVELLGNRTGRHTVTDLSLGIDKDGVGVDIRKLGTGLFKAHGVNVGNVVGGDVQVFLCRVDTAQGIVK